MLLIIQKNRHGFFFFALVCATNLLLFTLSSVALCTCMGLWRFFLSFACMRLWKETFKWDIRGKGVVVFLLHQVGLLCERSSMVFWPSSLVFFSFFTTFFHYRIGLSFIVSPPPPHACILSCIMWWNTEELSVLIKRKLNLSGGCLFHHILICYIECVLLRDSVS